MINLFKLFFVFVIFVKSINLVINFGKIFTKKKKKKKKNR